MSRNWEKYNRELVRRGEILIDPETIAVAPNKQKKGGRPYLYPEQLIMLLLLLKFNFATIGHSSDYIPSEGP